MVRIKQGAGRKFRQLHLFAGNLQVPGLMPSSAGIYGSIVLSQGETEQGRASSPGPADRSSGRDTGHPRHDAVDPSPVEFEGTIYYATPGGSAAPYPRRSSRKSHGRIALSVAARPLRRFLGVNAIPEQEKESGPVSDVTWSSRRRYKSILHWEGVVA